MNDITLCQEIDCPFKSSCIRYISRSNVVASWFSVTPYNNITESCEQYLSTYRFFERDGKLGLLQLNLEVIPPVYDKYSDVIEEFKFFQKSNQESKFMKPVLTDKQISKIIEYLVYEG